MGSLISPVALGINKLTSALHTRSREAGEVPARRFREIPSGQSFEPHCLTTYGNWRNSGSSYIIDEYTFKPIIEVTESGEVFDLNPDTLQSHYSLANSPAEFADSLFA